MGPERLADTPVRQIWRHGPIELVIDAEGEASVLREAHAAAWNRFQGVLPELVAELAVLREPVTPLTRCRGPVARRMEDACRAHLPRFITPMAAVAGAVAEAIATHYDRPGIRKACVNNGGDIAVVLGAGESVTVGVVADAYAPALDATLVVDAHGPVRGIATSGWRGRSQSLGIADAVTVLSRRAADADAAATMIANAVDVDHPAIGRAPASSLRDDSDLGDRMVTVAVPFLPEAAIEEALDRGECAAQALLARGLITGAALALQGRWRTIGAPLHRRGIGTAMAAAA